MNVSCETCHKPISRPPSKVASNVYCSKVCFYARTEHWSAIDPAVMASAVADYVLGMSSTAAAVKHGMSPSALTAGVKRLGHEVRGVGRQGHVSGEKFAAIVGQYQTGMTIKQLAKFYGVSASAVRRVLVATDSCIGAAGGGEKRMRSDSDYLINKKLSGYKSSAKNRGLEFNLSRDSFSILILSQCHYCGAAASSTIKRSRNPKHDRVLTCNGIDRVDNSMGYTIDNCVTCCLQCNQAKLDYSLDEFESWIAMAHKTLMKRRRDRNRSSSTA